MGKVYVEICAAHKLVTNEMYSSICETSKVIRTDRCSGLKVDLQLQSSEPVSQSIRVGFNILIHNIILITTNNYVLF